jgi:hypothetical protein
MIEVVPRRKPATRFAVLDLFNGFYADRRDAFRRVPARVRRYRAGQNDMELPAEGSALSLRPSCRPNPRCTSPRHVLALPPVRGAVNMQPGA